MGRSSPMTAAAMADAAAVDSQEGSRGEKSGEAKRGTWAGKSGEAERVGGAGEGNASAKRFRCASFTLLLPLLLPLPLPHPLPPAPAQQPRAGPSLCLARPSCH